LLRGEEKRLPTIYKTPLHGVFAMAAAVKALRDLGPEWSAAVRQAQARLAIRRKFKTHYELGCN
jgi:hypothetical protein